MLFRSPVSAAVTLIFASCVHAQQPLTAMPYSPSLDLTSLDRSADPCVDFYKRMLQCAVSGR